MLQEFREPDAREAEENLRIIRDLMERSTKYSTFSGLSGILAGVYSILGCLATSVFAGQAGGENVSRIMRTPDAFPVSFLLIWSLVILFAIGTDFLLTKRRAARVGKLVISRLGKQMFIGSAPGLGTGAALTLYFTQHHLLGDIYPVWMLCYGIAVCAVGLFSQREVTYLGLAFLLAGAATLLLFPLYGLWMMALTFGGFHIFYGFWMSRKDGW